jgi:hypothetical protein
MEINSTEKLLGTLSPVKNDRRDWGKKEPGRDFARILAEAPALSTVRESARERGERSLQQEEEPEKKLSEETSGEASSGAGLAPVSCAERGMQAEVSDVHAIVPLVDLEKILAAVHAQSLPGGQREVTLDLSQSVLEGLRIKLDLAPSGRLTVDFIAASEAVKTILEARSPELAELLRSRGVHLAALKTSLAEHNRHDDPREQGRFKRPDLPLPATKRRPLASRTRED